MSEENIVRFSRGEVPVSRTDWGKLREVPEREVTARANGDPDNLPLSDEELRRGDLVSMREMDGVPVLVHVPPDIHALLAESGDVSQRIVEVLNEHVVA